MVFVVFGRAFYDFRSVGKKRLYTPFYFPMEERMESVFFLIIHILYFLFMSRRLKLVNL